ncbi:hypothetical protein FBU59_000761, partial [Linderina macrospora]
MLADYPEVLNMRRIEPTPFHSALTPIASDWLGMDTTGMDGLQVAIMGYKNAYAHWRIGNQQQQHEHMAGMTPEQMREHVAVREVILSALIDSTSPEQLDSHMFGRQHNTTLHLAAFYNDANLVERLLRQGAAVDIRNKMGFLPASITNDKPTLQWLAMYREQVRGTRYQMYPPQQTPAQVQEYEVPQGSLMDPIAEPEVQMEMLEHFSDEEDVPEARSAGDLGLAEASGRSLGVQDSSNDDTCISGNNSDEHAKQSKRQSAQSDEYAYDHDDEVSLLSSSGDRTSLGLGGSRTSMEKRSSGSEHQSMQKKIFDKKRCSAYSGNSERPVSLVSIESAGSDSGRPRSSSNANSMQSSYYSAGGALGSESEYHSAHQSQAEDEEEHAEAAAAAAVEEAERSDTVSQRSVSGDPLPPSNNDRSIRIKVDPSTINDDDIEGIFSDSDDVVQQEPSYCQSGSGLSDSGKSVSPALSAISGKHLSLSSLSSSGSINMQSLAMAVEKAHKQEPVASPITAFPVSVQSIAAPVSEPPATKLAQITTSPTYLAKSGDDPAQRPTSPFSLRDSLYEMIMGRPASVASRTSTNSNSESSSSTVGVSASPFGVPVASEAAPESGSSSLTQSTEFTFRARADTLPDLQLSVNARRSEQTVSPLTANADVAVIHDEPEQIDEHQQSRTPSPDLAPRPTAASLFAIAEEPEVDKTESEIDVAEKEEDAYSEVEDLLVVAGGAALKLAADPVPVQESASESAVTAAGEHGMPSPADVMTRNGRIGRRGGRITAEMMADESAGFISEPVFTLASSKLSNSSLAESAAAKTDYDEPAQEKPELPANVPLTRDKREEYLQTLIKRNSSKPGAPTKPIPRFGAHSPIGKRPLSRPLSSLRMAESGAEESGEDGDDEEDNNVSAAKSPLRKKLLDERPSSRLDARSPSVMSNRSTTPVMPEKRTSRVMMAREAHNVSGASINGRIRAQTLNTLNTLGTTAPALQPRPSVRKISPSLANLKTRNLVSQSTARKTEQPSSVTSPVGVVPLRSRAMSTPADTRPPSSLLKAMTTPNNRTINLASMSASGSGLSSARIGRVAALSQNFECQPSPSRPTSFIEDRTSANPEYLGLTPPPAAATVPVIPKRPDLQSPVERSTSISSTFSRASGQESSSGAGGSSGVFHDSSDKASAGRGSDQPDRQQEYEDEGSGEAPGGGDSGAGNGGNDGDDDGNSSPPQSANTLERQDSTTSNSTTSSSSHSSDSLGSRSPLGGYRGGRSPLEGIAEDLELDHSAYEGYNIFTGSDVAGTPAPEDSPLPEQHVPPVPPARRTSDSAPVSVYQQPGLPTSLTNSPANERRQGSAPSSGRRDSQHGSRRKSGTLARISGSGVVRQRQALFNSAPQLVTASDNRSDSSLNRSEIGSPPGSGQRRFRSESVQVMSEGGNVEAAAFFRQAGEGHSSSSRGPVVGRPHPAAMVTGPAAIAATDSSESLGNTVRTQGGDSSSSGSNRGAARLSSDDHSRGSPRPLERRSPLPRIDVVDETRSRLSSNSSSKHSNESAESIFSNDSHVAADSVAVDPVDDRMGLAAQLNLSSSRLNERFQHELSIYHSRSSEELTPGLRAHDDAAVPFYPDPRLEGMNEGMEEYYPNPRIPSDEYISIDDLDKIDDDEIVRIEMRRQAMLSNTEKGEGEERDSRGPFNLSTVFEEDEERSSMRASRASLNLSREWQPETGNDAVGRASPLSLPASRMQPGTPSPRRSVLSTVSEPVQIKQPEMQERPRPLSQPPVVIVRRMSVIS